MTPPQAFESQLNNWMATLTMKEKNSLTSVHLKTLLSLKQVQTLWDFLHTVVSFRDSSLRGFWFRTSELCALLKAHVVSGIETGYYMDFERLLGYSAEEARQAVSGREVDLLDVVSRFSPQFDPGDMIRRRYWRRALVFYMVSRYCLVTGRKETGDASILRIVDQM